MSRKKGGGEGKIRVRTMGGRKVYWARWVAYDAKGEQKRPEKILGTVSEIGSKAEARELLNKHIRETTGKIATGPSSPTFREVWARYVAMKTPEWSKVNRKTVTSIFARAILPAIGERDIASLTLEPLQAALNHMVQVPVGNKGQRSGYGKSALQKAKRCMGAVFKFAIDENIIEKDPSRKLRLPKHRKGCERFYSIDEIQRLWAAAEARDRLILRAMVIGGLRPAELFALKADDIETKRLRIDEAVKDAEVGPDRIGETKTEGSNGYVAISEELERELRMWAATRPAGLLFPTRAGTPWRIGNYLKRVLKPLAASLNPPILDMTHQALRRSFATHFQKHGTMKDTQAQMRHSRPETTMQHYQKELPNSVQVAVEEFEKELGKVIQ